MYHSIYFIPDDQSIKVNGKFQGKNTWTDFRLIPTNRPVFAPTEPILNLIDVAGTNGGVDLSTMLVGYPAGTLTMKRRTGEIEFLVADYDKRLPSDSFWAARYSNIARFLHGRLMKAVLEDEPSVYRRGRFWLTKWDPQKDWSRISIQYNIEPDDMPV